MSERYGDYQLREAAGFWWLIDMAQTGEDFRMPLRLNGTGAQLFRELSAGCGEAELAERMAPEYGIEKEELRRDIAAFAAQLAANGIRFAQRNGEK